MALRGKIEVGQRYRIIRNGGAPLRVVWEVVKVFVPWQDGLEHARLQSVNDRGGTMIFATSVIADKARFVRAQ